jgi:hypothetical protein
MTTAVTYIAIPIYATHHLNYRARHHDTLSVTVEHHSSIIDHTVLRGIYTVSFVMVAVCSLESLH